MTNCVTIPQRISNDGARRGLWLQGEVMKILFRSIVRAWGGFLLTLILSMGLPPVLCLAGSDTPMVRLHGYVPAGAIANSELLGPLPATTEISLAFSLPLRNQQELEELIKRIHDPADPLYGTILPPKSSLTDSVRHRMITILLLPMRAAWDLRLTKHIPIARFWMYRDPLPRLKPHLTCASITIRRSTAESFMHLTEALKFPSSLPPA